MILFLALAAGFALGYWRAKRRDGTLADRLQWGAAHGVAGVVLVAVLSLVLGLAGVSPL